MPQLRTRIRGHECAANLSGLRTYAGIFSGEAGELLRKFKSVTVGITNGYFANPVQYLATVGRDGKAIFENNMEVKEICMQNPKKKGDKHYFLANFSTNMKSIMMKY